MAAAASGGAQGDSSPTRKSKRIATLTGRWGLRFSADIGSMSHDITDSRRLLGMVMWSM